MKTIFVLGVAAAVLAGCTVRETTVRQEAAPPRVVYAPPPTVVYQSPAPTVVYQQQQPLVYSAPSTQSVSVTYSGAGGYELAWQKADTYCDEHYGNTRVRLISDVRAAGRAVFACDTL